MTNIQKLESAIRQAIPELMELTEGCEINYLDSLGGNKYTVISEADDGILRLKEKYRNIHAAVAITSVDKRFKIIGHPVTILHLFRYLMATGTIRLVSVTDVMLLMVGETKISINLAKPMLRDQSEDVINELVKLLK